MTAPVFAFAPDWTDPIVEVWRYQTEVQQAYDGREIRRALRHWPRRELTYRILPGDQPTRAAMFRRAARLVGLRCRVPIWPDAVRCAVDAGATSLATPTAGLDFVTGGQALLWESPTKFHVCENLTVTPASVTWTNAAPTAFSGVLVPLREATMEPAATAEVFTVDLERWQFEFLLSPSEPLGRVQPGTYGSYDGRPVFELPSGEDGRRGETRRRVGVADFGVGVRAVYAAWSAAATTYDFQWTLTHRASIAEALEWVHRHRGRWGWFWWDAHASDLRLTADIGAGDTTLSVEPIGGYPLTLYGATPPAWRRDIVIRLRNGAVYRRRITSWTGASVTLNSALGVAATVGETRRIGWLTPARFDNDAFELRWPTTRLMQLRARIRSILTTAA